MAGVNTLNAKNVGKTIANLRKKSGMTQQTLAEKYTLEFLNEELGKSSEFYTQNFITPTATETETETEKETEKETSKETDSKKETEEIKEEINKNELPLVIEPVPTQLSTTSPHTDGRKHKPVIRLLFSSTASV